MSIQIIAMLDLKEALMIQGLDASTISLKTI